MNPDPGNIQKLLPVIKDPSSESELQRQRRLRSSYFFRGEGGARFLDFEAHLFLVSGFEHALDFLIQISWFERLQN